MAEIKISDLSVGDWVEVYGAANKVWYLNKQDEINDTINDYWVKPIPLTPAILEKNGFVKWQGGLVLIGDEISCRYEDGNLTIKQGYRDNEEALVERLLVNIECKAVHQLQHALRLAGVEKEIVL